MPRGGNNFNGTGVNSGFEAGFGDSSFGMGVPGQVLRKVMSRTVTHGSPDGRVVTEKAKQETTRLQDDGSYKTTAAEQTTHAVFDGQGRNGGRCRGQLGGGGGGGGGGVNPRGRARAELTDGRALDVGTAVLQVVEQYCTQHNKPMPAAQLKSAFQSAFGRPLPLPPGQPLKELLATAAPGVEVSSPPGKTHLELRPGARRSPVATPTNSPPRGNSPCRYGARCTFSGCRYQHPPPAAGGGGGVGSRQCVGCDRPFPTSFAGATPICPTCWWTGGSAARHADPRTDGTAAVRRPPEPEPEPEPEVGLPLIVASET
jgi:hypothetical protein